MSEHFIAVFYFGFESIVGIHGVRWAPKAKFKKRVNGMDIGSPCTYTVLFSA
jgi:hypothetical protein